MSYSKSKETLAQLAIAVGDKLKEREWKLATAESCTAGGISYWITSVPGSSAWFERGFVCYSDLSKEELLGVNPLTLSTHGAVSAQTACEMAEGALRHSQAQVSVSVTGVAGPDGGTREKPAGTVWFAWASVNSATQSSMKHFSGDRAAVREQSIVFALEKLLEFY